MGLPALTPPSYRRLALRLVVVLAIPGLLAGLLAYLTFPLSESQVRALDVALPASVAVLHGITLLVLRAAAAPLRRALEGDEDVANAVRAAHRLPSTLGLAVLGLSAAGTAVVVGAVAARGLAPDLVVAGALLGMSAGTLGAMLIYWQTESAMARVLARLGPVPGPPERGTVRGKILGLGFGLLTISLTLFASVGYVQTRADAEADALSALDRVQEAALVEARGSPGPETAVLVHQATRCATALYGPGGRLLARSGDPQPAVAPGPDGVWPVPGGWLVRHSDGRGTVLASFLRSGPAPGRQAAFWRKALLVGVAVYACAALLAWLAARAIAQPLRALGDAAGRIAAGDLSAGPPSTSRDELGELAAEFRRMSQGLQGLVGAVQEATRGVGEAAAELSGIGDRVRDGALDQRAGLGSVDRSMQAIQESVARVSRGLTDLSEYVSSTGALSAETAKALEELRRQGAELEDRSERAMQEVQSLGSAGDRAGSALERLNDLAGRTGETVTRVHASLSGLELAAVASQLNAAQAEELAGEAGDVVRETLEGMERLRAAVGDARRRVTALGRRAGDIDQIVDFIADVAGRTNLLSLNASIIAAQAGEHGRAFAVVAEQIRDLASQIARSTKSIGEIIRAVREDVDGTARLIGRGDELAGVGVRLAQNSARALGQIKAATAQGHENAARIQSALQAHALSTRDVSQLVSGVAEGSGAVAAAVERIGTSAAAITTVGAGVEAVAEKVNRALEEQAALARRQLEGLERLEAMIEEVTRAVADHGDATAQVQAYLRGLSGTSNQHGRAVGELSSVARRLEERARDLSERVGRFRTS
jgi:methyl-accepting chemotaxis protein